MAKHSRNLIIIICILIFLLSLYLSVFAGHLTLTFKDFIDFLSFRSTDNSNILGVLRIPRSFKAVIAGVCLATSGLFMQTMTKNPLVEPYITGVSSGAGIALVTGILFEVSPFYYPILAFAGAITASMVVMSFAGLNKFSLVKLILIGLSINIFAGSLMSMLIITNSSKSHNMMVILAGNLNSSLFVYTPLIILFVIAMIASIFMVPKLNFYRLDNNIVSVLSGNKKNNGIFLVVLSAILASISVCAAGILGFVGIIIPHLSRLIVGIDFRWLFFVNMLLGASIVLFSDFIARNIIYPMEIPLGIVLSMLGAPIFIGFLIFKGRNFSA
ncbi:MAG: hypothetical protein A2287_02725 [Candidatus Melainabacteria bacterium RIFOXYA12_FULL_32_12]|nr:MAG: hypothetical protein A2287_02725 [Candidatus Melainabacteria bacterium RIFOXYA12_FULL_32_12]